MPHILEEPFFRKGERVVATDTIIRRDGSGMIARGELATVINVYKGTDASIITIKSDRGVVLSDIVCFSDKHPLKKLSP